MGGNRADVCAVEGLMLERNGHIYTSNVLTITGGDAIDPLSTIYPGRSGVAANFLATLDGVVSGCVIIDIRDLGAGPHYPYPVADIGMYVRPGDHKSEIAHALLSVAAPYLDGRVFVVSAACMPGSADRRMYLKYGFAASRRAPGVATVSTDTLLERTSSYHFRTRARLTQSA
jgi:hypothetical protein